MQNSAWEFTGIDYANPKTPFVDRYAIFCLHFSSTSLGLGRIGLRSNPFIYRFLEPAARLELKGNNGGWYPVRRRALHSFPSWVEEEGSVDGLEVRIRYVFVSGRHLLCEITWKNCTNETISVPWRWKGFIPQNEAVLEQYLAPFAGLPSEGLESWVCPGSSGIQGGWRTTRTITSYPCPNFGLHMSGASATSWTEGPSGQPQAASHGQQPLFFALAPTEALLLNPGESRPFLLSFHVRWGNDHPGEPDWDSLHFANALRSAQEDFQQEINVTNPPIVDCRVLRPHAWRARHALLRSGFQDADGEFEGKAACLCTSDDQFFSTVFFWDALFSSAALATFNARYAREALQTVFVRQDPRDGSCPENKWNFTVPERNMRQFPQAPVGAWAATHYLHHHPEDAAFLPTLYPILRKNHQFWDQYGDSDGDGLAEWRWTGQTADDSPLFDAVVPGGEVRGCQWLPPIASVQLNCFLYKDARLLEAFAAKQGLAEDVSYFQQRQHHLQARLMDVCFVAEDGKFWDYNHATRTHTKVPTFYLFWPLFAGMDLPDEVRRSLIENELLNPERFFGAIPFPSVSYDHPKFDPKGYWRGKSWPHISYWLLETLVQHGKVEEARSAGQRILSWMSSRNGFVENFETDPRLIESSGHLDYNWGSAAFLLMASEQYLKFTP